MYDRILVPLDGSEASESALVFAERLTCRTISLLRVEPKDHLLVPPSVTGVEPDWEERYAGQIREALEVLAQPLRERGRSVEVDIRFGDAAEEIIASATSADLIVMTTHGRGAAGRLIFGSTADRVARYGMTPTLLIRRGAHAIGPVTPSRVIVPLDGSDLAERALPEAERLAGVLDVPLHLVRAVGADEILLTVRAQSGTSQVNPSAIDDDYERARLETERAAEAYLAARADGIRDLPVSTELLKGTPAFVLLWAIKADDVVVMATHGLGGYRRWMIGSVADKLVREAAAPVLLVRDEARSASGAEASPGE